MFFFYSLSWVQSIRKRLAPKRSQNKCWDCGSCRENSLLVGEEEEGCSVSEACQTAK